MHFWYVDVNKNLKQQNNHFQKFGISGLIKKLTSHQSGQENLFLHPYIVQNYSNLLRASLPTIAPRLTERPLENSLNSEIRFACNVCQKSYKNKRHLYRHQKEECVGVEPKFRCEICSNMFRRKYHLSRHMFSRHGTTLEGKLLKAE